MNFFRFPESIPTIFYTIIWICLLAAISLGTPYYFTDDLNLLISLKNNNLVSNFPDFINPHLILLNLAIKISNVFALDNYLLLRFLNFIYLGLVILVTYKIIKLKFYDLHYLMPLTAVLLSGTILISITTINGPLLSGLITLLIIYYLIRIFDEEKILNVLFFILFSLIALILNNFFFIILISFLTILKLFNLKLEKKKRLSLISYLCSIYIIALIFLIIQGIDETDNLSTFNYDLSILMQRIIESIIFLLPLISLLIIAIFYNVFKRVNWNKDLITFFSLIIISWFLFIFSKKLNLSILVFMLPIMSIYIFRTLEFVELKWSKIFLISLILIPAIIIYFDTSLYQNMSDIPHINYLFYSSIILASLINPIFSLQKKSITAVYKTISFSLILTLFFSMIFFYSQYMSKTLSFVIPDTLVNELNCDIQKSEFILEKDHPLDLMLFFSDKIDPDYFSDCQIVLTFSSIDSTPIDDRDAINKTILDLTSKSYINLNFKKL